MSTPEYGSLHLPACIRSAYERVFSKGPLRESLLNVSSYRLRIREGTGHLTLHDIKWAAIAATSAITFGIATAQFLGRIP